MVFDGTKKTYCTINAQLFWSQTTNFIYSAPKNPKYIILLNKVLGKSSSNINIKKANCTNLNELEAKGLET
jgi:hypothetical protein